MSSGAFRTDRDEVTLVTGKDWMLAAYCTNKKSSGNPDMNGQLHFLRFISRRRDAAYFILVQPGQQT